MKNHVMFKFFAVSLFLVGSVSAWAQTCQRSDEMPEAARKAVESAAQQVFDQSARGDVQSLQSSAIPSLQSSFNGVAAAVNDNKDAFQGAKSQLRSVSGISPQAADVLAREAVSDWLLRCPLEFE